jgi:N,N'-diacetylchitobiose transport system permease protein
MGAILGYPIYNLVRLSLQRYGLFELIQHHGVYIGLHNFGSVLHDPVFWHTLLRTVVFTVVNVGLTMGIGTLVALLLLRVSAWVRILITAGLVFVWAMPPVVAVQVWNWMTNSQNGILNYVLTEAHVGNYFQHNWFVTPFWQLFMVTTLIVWGALPFVTITLYAALSQVPHELVEAAEIDGARSWRVFRDVTMPVIMPVLVRLTSLSSIWDFRRLHAAVSAHRPGARDTRQLPDGYLPVRGGLREGRLRPRRRHLDPHAGHRRGAERRLRPANGPDE